MDRQGFIDFNTRLSRVNSGKADSYARAIKILDNVLPYQNVINLHGQSLYDLHDVSVIEAVLHFVNDEVRKMKNNQSCRVTAPADAPTYVWHVFRAVQTT